MPTPRRSARVAAQDSSPVYTDPSESGKGTKRKSEAGTSPSAKRGKKSSKTDVPQQQTIEDTMDIDNKGQDKPETAENGDTSDAAVNKQSDPDPTPEKQVSNDAPEEDAAPSGDAVNEAEPSEEPAKPKADEPQASGALQPASETENQKEDQEPAKHETSKAQETPEKNGTTETKDDATAATNGATNGDAVVPDARDNEVPSSILEKGIVYFFFRARVNVTDPQDVKDIARSYMILRPLPQGAKLSDGPIGDEGNCRLIAIPKKVLPQSGKDRFMVFVEGAKKSFNDLKESFLASNEYATKTSGTSHSPEATPVAEGVYAITTTGRDSHFAYMTTIPSSPGEVQKDVGIKDQGSFVVSAKNPKYPGPANASLDNPPDYPQEIMDEFRDLRWMPLQPKLLDYVNTQFLLIGESSGVDGALEQLPRDEKEGLENPKEELEKLEGEDEIRVKHLKGDDAIFADLGVSKEEYPSVPTTWNS